ncbi:transmembrane protein [[Clostridium] sordellii]|uniref:MFS transporter n=2 Tax=Paraclostridium sordellii TaxID=1505 RepID=UPI0005E80D02|nr:MFS transporter [Paeniclostridium sordellii]MDU4413317.1 MFS transporter [Paeniclostridium sordellii]MRZ30454.1 MFS transporter [Paeniclostridium sordellii]MVO75170.1 MFS transporter [Paeniclostridium sordellii]CEN86827.1 transmembrane protein [[Clostridium] sordellii] [Paeniclostridium sordellii]CEO34470.1 transmembrane protein [[Clostridium] sordellii] [Paeniclostridium sordellii]
MENSLNTSKEMEEVNIKKAVPAVLALMIFALVIDNSFKIISADLASAFNLSATAVSWQVTLAGLVIGIGAIVYASLADSISIRNLLILGIFLICIGSLMGFIFQKSFFMIIISRIIQAAGLGSAETLYVIFVAKYFKDSEQKKYLGFSTSSFAISQVIGTLTGGYISTYLHWTVLFLIPLLTLLILPFILKYIPKEKSKGRNIDFIGFILVSSVAASLMLFVSDFNWIYLVALIIALILFVTYISKNKKAFISIEFFKNRNFISVLLVAFVIYSVQLAFIFMFPFLIEYIYNYRLDQVSLLLVPSYILAAIVGAMSGNVAKRFGSKQCIQMAIIGIIISLVFGSLFIQTSVYVFVFVMILFSSSFAFMYAPMIDTLIKTIPKEHSGTAIGFYNFCLNIAASIGITYVAVLMETKSLGKNIMGLFNNAICIQYSNVLIALAVISVVALALYWSLIGRREKSENI